VFEYRRIVLYLEHYAQLLLMSNTAAILERKGGSRRVAKETLDVAGLYAALSAKRRAEELSWRQLAQRIGISASTLTRLANGQRPDVDAFLTLVRWLGVPAEQFVAEEQESGRQPDLLVQLMPLLQARDDLAPKDKEYLEEILRAAVRHIGRTET
jgi:transcriptional regulator with XRE-family HTH domain